VDDEADARELIQAVLERAGAEVVAAGSVGEALAAFERQRPDVLLSDIEMPGVDGYAFVKMVRALPPERGGATPAAALTAYASAEDRRLALGAGFQVHLAKPALPGDVVAAVATLAGRRSVGEPTKGGAAC
jgi:CheY-like chemotaxis protein